MAQPGEGPTLLLGLEIASPERALPHHAHGPAREAKILVWLGASAALHGDSGWLQFQAALCGLHFVPCPQVVSTSQEQPSQLQPPLTILHCLSSLVLGDFPLMCKLAYYLLKSIYKNFIYKSHVFRMQKEVLCIFHLGSKTKKKSSFLALKHSKHLKYKYSEGEK